MGDFDLFVDDDGQAYSAFKRAGTGELIETNSCNS